MKKITTIILTIATAGLLACTGYAATGFDFAPGFHFNYGAGFSGFATALNAVPFGFGGTEFGPFGYFNTFGGFAGTMTAAPFGFGGFGGMDFALHAVMPVNKIVPISPADALAAAPISFDESGELVVRPFDDEDLFVED